MTVSKRKNTAAISKCRVCGGNFFEKQLLLYKNMPKSAQFLPGKTSLNRDRGIDLGVHQCSGCGLVQLSNRPVSYYREVIRASAVSEEMKIFRKKQFSSFVQKYLLKKKKLLKSVAVAESSSPLCNNFA
ncbi:MAG: hypothetical protein A4E71_00711 [Smithella sp. PtaU1.Bin162]|nr:MAG: hypothetical protein A4E71_00711 [Smithella sp. PtaU1.Bin162]